MDTLCFRPFLWISFSPITAVAEEFVFETDTIRYIINSAGLNVGLQEKSTGKDWIAIKPSPFAHVTLSGKTHPVTELSRDGDLLIAKFGKTGVMASYQISAHKTHITIELKSLKGAEPDNIELCSIQTTAFPNTGYTIAAQWNDDITICLMALSERVNSHVKGKSTISSTIYPEFGMVGEKVALIAVPTSTFLNVVQEVEKTYGLPSPTIDGVWAKRSPDIDTNYLFIDLSEKTADQVITYAKMGGFKYVLVPWRSWAESRGSYPINTKNFPKGEESLKAVIGRFHAAGLKVGMHMMTSLVSKNDPLVRPRPDRRLLKDSATALAEDIGARKPTIKAKDDLSAFSDDVRQHDEGVDRGIDIQIDEEIIFCKETGRTEPNVFSNCQRGAYGTAKKPHKAGTPVYRLAQGAGAYMANLKTSLNEQIADRIAGIVNHCGFDMIYFDGSELDRANGPFWYYVGQQQAAIWKRIEKDMLYQGSAMSHWLWHIFSRKTCGDHAAIAVKNYMDYYKLNIMKNYRANFMPAELGWCGLLAGGLDHPATTLDDIEHYGARMIAYDVPISIQTSLKQLKNNPDSAAILERLKIINELRCSDKLSKPQREQFKTGNWSLFGASDAMAIKQLKPEKFQAHIEGVQADAAAGDGRVLFQGDIELTTGNLGEKSSLPGIVICSIYCSDQGATEKDCRLPLATDDAETPVAPQDLREHHALTATIRVSSPQKTISSPYPVLNIQLEDKRGWYRDHYMDLDFTGEKTIMIPKTNVERLLPEFGRPAYKLKRAFRYFDYSGVAAVNLRWMRKPKNTSITIFLEKISAVSPQKITSSAAKNDR